MLTIDKLVDYLEKVNMETGINIYLFNNSQKKFLNIIGNADIYSKVEIYDLIIDEKQYILFIEGSKLTAREQTLTQLLISNFLEKEGYKSTIKKDLLIQRLISGKLPQQEIKELCNTLGLSYDLKTIIFTIQVFNDCNINDIISIIESIGIENTLTYQLNTNKILVISQYENQEEDLPRIIVDTIEAETLEKIKMGVSSLRNVDIINLAFYESVNALELGLKFGVPGTIYNYKSLFYYRILSLIPEGDLLDLYNNVIEWRISGLIQDEIKTANSFIDSNLNISEAARNLYIHRNTLIYRLDKIQKETGFDLREFKDALEFRLFIAIYNYINSNNSKKSK